MEVPHHAGGRGPGERVAGAPQPLRWRAVQDPPRSPGDVRRPHPAPSFARRAAPAVERAARPDVAGGSTSATAGGGGAVRGGRASPPAREAGYDRPVAGQRPRRTALAGDGPPRPLLCRELVGRTGPDGDLEDDGRGPARTRCLLAATWRC